MLPKSATLFKVLLNRFHPGMVATGLKCLSPEESQEILNQKTGSQECAAAINWTHQLIKRTHYSWLLPLIQKLPSITQGPMIAALPQPQSDKIKNLLKITVPSPLPPAIQHFLLDNLIRVWQPQEGIPIEFLPPSTLSPLLNLSKREIVTLIDFLALYDVADSIRHIVDKRLLKNIYECLTPEQQQYLRICLHKKEKLTAPKLDIAKWDGKPESFINMLHRRGMLRLGKALCGQSPQFVWHLTHILDTGRGKALAEYHQPAEISGITPLLIQQVLALLNFLKPKSVAS